MTIKLIIEKKQTVSEQQLITFQCVKTKSVYRRLDAEAE